MGRVPKKEYTTGDKAQILWVYTTNDMLSRRDIQTAYGYTAYKNLPSWKRDRRLLSYIAEKIGGDVEDVEWLIEQKELGINRMRRAFNSKGPLNPFP